MRILSRKKALFLTKEREVDGRKQKKQLVNDTLIKKQLGEGCEVDYFLVKNDSPTQEYRDKEYVGIKKRDQLNTFIRLKAVNKDQIIAIHWFRQNYEQANDFRIASINYENIGCSTNKPSSMVSPISDRSIKARETLEYIESRFCNNYDLYSLLCLVFIEGKSLRFLEKELELDRRSLRKGLDIAIKELERTSKSYFN